VLDRRQDGQARLKLAVSLAALPPYQILESGFLDRFEPLAPAARDRYLDMWRHLQDENAPLRVLNEGGSLMSASISFFDPMLLSYATHNWRKVAMVVGDGLAKFWDDYLVQTGDLVLVARIRALVTAGVLEAQGDLDDPRDSEVRLASKRR
jgi:hypothetical protein